MPTYKIEDDVPLPADGIRYKRNVFPFAEMRVGQSFSVPIEEVQKLRMAKAQYVYRHRDVQFTVRRDINLKVARCWRTA